VTARGHRLIEFAVALEQPGSADASIAATDVATDVQALMLARDWLVYRSTSIISLARGRIPVWRASITEFRLAPSAATGLVRRVPALLTVPAVLYLLTQDRMAVLDSR
jgi:hypothetical protein